MKMKLAAVIFAILVLYFVLDTVCGVAAELRTCIQDTKAAEAHWKLYSEFKPMRATAYCLNGRTATGTQTREGIAAGPPEWFGMMAAVYEDSDGAPGDLIGLYRIEDTGGEPIRTGRVLDIWMPTEEECLEFGNKKVQVYLMKEEIR